MNHTTMVGIGASLALLAANPAFAQSSVTLYGLLDLGVQTLTHAGPNGGSVTGMQSGNLHPSMFGISGREALGGGYAAVFRLESGINLANGAQQSPSATFNRYAYVGLETPYGQFTFGRQYGLMYDALIFYDPGRFSQYGAVSTGLIPIATLQPNNAVKWKSPQIGGVSAEAMYSFGAQIPGHMAAGTYWGGLIQYRQGPFSARATFEQSRGTIDTIDTSARVDRRASVAARYQWRAFTAIAGYANISGDLQLSPPGNLYYGGLLYQATPALVMSAGAFHYQTRQQGQPTWYVFTATYGLSKRTSLYALAGWLDNHGGKAFTLNAYDFQSPGGMSQTGLIAGIKHAF